MLVDYCKLFDIYFFLLFKGLLAYSSSYFLYPIHHACYVFVKKLIWHYALLYAILFNACFSQLSLTIILIEFYCQYKHFGLLQSIAWSMLLMPFFGMPINALHPLVFVCTSYFPLLAFHMYSRACVNVIYILLCILHPLFHFLPCCISP